MFFREFVIRSWMFFKNTCCLQYWVGFAYGHPMFLGRKSSGPLMDGICATPLPNGLKFICLPLPRVQSHPGVEAAGNPLSASPGLLPWPCSADPRLTAVSGAPLAGRFLLLQEPSQPSGFYFFILIEFYLRFVIGVLGGFFFSFLIPSDNSLSLHTSLCKVVYSSLH